MAFILCIGHILSQIYHRTGAIWNPGEFSAGRIREDRKYKQRDPGNKNKCLMDKKKIAAADLTDKEKPLNSPTDLFHGSQKKED